MSKQVNLPQSEHFELKELAEGVYAALGKAGSPTFSNAGIIDLGSQTLVLDAFELPAAGADLRAAAEQLTGRPVTAVILSHVHSDHSVGLQAFAPGTPILSSPAIRDGLPDAVGWVRHWQEHPDELEAALAAERERLAAAADESQRAGIGRTIARLEHLLAALPTLTFRLPDLTFAGRLTFHGSRRTVELHTVEPGHTASDIYLLLPKDRICFMGDLGFFQSQPFMVFCDPEAWMAWLAQAETFDVEVFVPGHGLPGTKADLARQRQYIAALEAMVGEVIAEGVSVDEALARPLPGFESWIAASTARWEANVQSAYERQSGEPGE
jgi:glyoxylase-like metal-dependent hydrolase (beta-lactamase superfamily II)